MLTNVLIKTVSAMKNWNKKWGHSDYLILNIIESIIDFHIKHLNYLKVFRQTYLCYIKSGLYSTLKLCAILSELEL